MQFSCGIVLLLLVSQKVLSQEVVPSTRDLSFLLGEWEITHTYSPGAPGERTQKGTMNCQLRLNDQFIQCSYQINRPGKAPALLEVFFNYNRIYDQYESLWLSSTWPIKVLESGPFTVEGGEKILKGTAEFVIEDGVIEYVRDELRMTEDHTFIRKTHIRTSAEEEGSWRHHMTEEAVRIRG